MDICTSIIILDYKRVS